MKTRRILSLLPRLTATAILATCFAVDTAHAEDDPSAISPHDATNIVVRAYRQELDREPDQSGMATFVGHLLAGKTESWLHDVLRQSPEAQAMRKQKRDRAMHIYVFPPIFVALGLLWGYGAQRLRRFNLCLAMLLALLLPVSYFALIMRYGINVPSWDDFDAILGYAIKPAAERFHSLLAQHNEHRIAFTRIISEGLLNLRGCIDFKAIALIGNGFLVGTFFLMARQLKAHTCYLPVLALLLFAPVAWINMAWSMAAVQNNGVHFFALAAIMMFFSAKSYPVRAMLLLLGGACAAFTSGSGILLFPAILLTLVGQWVTAHRENSGRNYRGLLDIVVVERNRYAECR